MVKNDCRLAAATTGALEMQSIHIYMVQNMFKAIQKNGRQNDLQGSNLT